ncbi:MAG: type II toxin-antitoxin system RelE/ParE family toxin [Candidatus Solibacter usitatus]|nr:type II toxin-antitoxin system RelE/ParE family toxin [Candidatus Solibacter usitatus]
MALRRSREQQHRRCRSFDLSITARFWLLAQHSQVGRRCDHDLRPGLRSFPVGEYIIVYRIEGEDVLILHVIRGNRDIASQLEN